MPTNGSRRDAVAAGYSVGTSSATEPTRHPVTTQASRTGLAAGPTFLLWIEGKPGRAICDLRNLLKRLLRDHHFRCLDGRGGRR